VRGSGALSDLGREIPNALGRRRRDDVVVSQQSASRTNRTRRIEAFVTKCVVQSLQATAECI
jgi:hypothetical protein